ncbi:MAG: bifunctional nuclease family protein, partial [SAR202 cluster bacterium]|nr:bifunctional nuclease family protein [SAR202 cluster bacterium]
MHEVNVDSIRVSLVNYQRVVILKDKTSGKSIPIWIGSAEADSIAVKLQGVSVPRPLTHDLMKSMIDLFNGDLQCINVTDLEDETFFAQLVFNSKGKLLELDARPS